MTWKNRAIAMRTLAAAATLAVIMGLVPAAAKAQGSTTTTSAQDQTNHKSGGLWSKLSANAKYQQAKQNGASPTELAAIKNGTEDGAPVQSGSSSSGSSKNKPLCKMSDPDVHLVDGNWAGPNCIAVDANGKPVHPEEVKKQNSDSDQEKRASDIESHSCMTTDGADKANALAGDCEKVTSAPHKDCNIQQNSCDEIRKATQKGCWGKGAEGPDWCLTKYN